MQYLVNKDEPHIAHGNINNFGRKSQSSSCEASVTFIYCIKFIQKKKKKLRKKYYCVEKNVQISAKVK